MFKDIFHTPQIETELKILEQQWQIIREQLFQDRADFQKLFEACDWIFSHLRLAKWSQNFHWVILIQAMHFLKFRQGQPAKELDPLLMLLYSNTLNFGMTVAHFIEAFEGLEKKEVFAISPECLEIENRSNQTLVEVAATYWPRTNQPIPDMIDAIECMCSTMDARRQIVLLKEVAKIITMGWIKQNNASEVLAALTTLQQWGVPLDQVSDGRMNLISMIIFSWRRIKVPIKDLQAALRYLISQGVDMKSPGLLLSSPLHNIGESFIDIYRFHDVKETVECFFPDALDPHRLLHVTDRLGQTPLLVMVDRWLESTVSFGQVFGVIKSFIDRGADINAADKSGLTLFHCVVKRNPGIFTRGDEGKELLHFLFAKDFKLTHEIDHLYFIGIHQYISCKARAVALTTFSTMFKALSEVQTPEGIKKYHWILESAVPILGIPFLESLIGVSCGELAGVIASCIVLRHNCQRPETLKGVEALYQKLSLRKVDHPWYSETLEFAQKQIVSLATIAQPLEFMLGAKFLVTNKDWNEATSRYCQALDSYVRQTYKTPEDEVCLSNIDEVVSCLAQLPVKVNAPSVLKVLILLIRAKHLNIDYIYRLLEAYNLTLFFSKTPFEPNSGGVITPDSVFGDPPHIVISAAQSCVYLSNCSEEQFSEFLENARTNKLKPGETQIFQILKAFSEAMKQENSSLPKSFFSADIQFMSRLNTLMNQQCSVDISADNDHQGGGFGPF